LNNFVSFVHNQPEKVLARFSSFSVHRKFSGNTENQKQKSSCEFNAQVQLSTEKNLFY